MSGNIQFQLLVLLVGFVSAGLSAYVGVRVGMAEFKKELRYQKDDLIDHDERLKYLERRGARQGHD